MNENRVVFPSACVRAGGVRVFGSVWEKTDYLVDPASGICLSQRLSHASLSISYSEDETANGSVKQQ